MTDREQVATDIARSVWNGYAYRDRVPAAGIGLGGRPALTGIDPERVGEFVVLSVRDPLGGHGADHAIRLASQFGPAELVGETGLFQTATAQCDGYRVSVVTTGSGAPEVELALGELMNHTAAHTYLYFGVAAGFHPHVEIGDLVISSGVVRGDGVTREYIDAGFPAAASYDVVSAFVGAAAHAGAAHRVGVTRSSDSDSVGIGRPAVRGWMQPQHAETLEYWIRAGVLCNDREASPVVTLSNLFGYRTGALYAVTDNYTMGERIEAGAGTGAAVEVLVDGVRRLAAMDAETRAAGRRYWAPAEPGVNAGGVA